MKWTIILVLGVLTACSKSSRGSKPNEPIVNFTPSVVAAQLVYPSSNQLEYEGELIADLSQAAAVVSSFGEVLKGRTLNPIILSGIEFIVYGDDGVFATECEPHVDYPTHGPSHPNCQIAHAESYDRIIICSSTQGTTPVMTAQNWPGVTLAMTDSSLGMECWVNGVKMISKKVFTY